MIEKFNHFLAEDTFSRIYDDTEVSESSKNLSKILTVLCIVKRCYEYVIYVAETEIQFLKDLY